MMVKLDFSVSLLTYVPSFFVRDGQLNFPKPPAPLCQSASPLAEGIQSQSLLFLKVSVT